MDRNNIVTIPYVHVDEIVISINDIKLMPTCTLNIVIINMFEKWLLQLSFVPGRCIALSHERIFLKHLFILNNFNLH